MKCDCGASELLLRVNGGNIVAVRLEFGNGPLGFNVYREIQILGQAHSPQGVVINVPIALGPCEPNWKSLGDHFKSPTWWREAKIGMWLHWGPQSVGEDGDWYAKWIYMPKHAWGGYTRVYPHHLDRVRPSKRNRLQRHAAAAGRPRSGIPEKLMALYKRAGARYVIGQGMHHDNFDLWDSKYQPWNAVKLGPASRHPWRLEEGGRQARASASASPFMATIRSGGTSRHSWRPGRAEEGRSLRRRTRLRRQGDLVEEHGPRPEGPLRHRPQG